MPFRAAITGFGKRSIRFMVDSTLSRKPLVPLSPACVLTYLRSAPAQKARPVPVNTTDITSPRLCASLSAWSIPRSTAGVSESHFCRIFREGTGLTLTDYINRSRIESARQMLLKADARVSEIAFEVG